MTTDADALVEVTRVPSEFAAESIAIVLRDAGIEAFVFAAERSWTGGIGFATTRGGVPVMVRRADRDDATAVLAENATDGPLEDPDDPFDQPDEARRSSARPLAATISAGVLMLILILCAIGAAIILFIVP
ncbi:MAG: DUF2007 domain-containing protein [Phycisphaerales bacterium]|nr:DUF2007 domain-containing protein [Phycisphaerales bacterium]